MPIFQKYISPMKVRTMKAAGLDIIEDRRDGACVWDITGKKYIDCQTGSGIMNVGRHNREIVEALKKALDTYDIGVFLLCSKPKADLAKKLAEITPGDLKCTVFGVGGGEANDAAIKIARGYTMKKEIIYTDKAYHGHTGFALSAIGREAYKEPFEPLMPGLHHGPLRRHRRDEEGGHRRHRRGHPRADPGRGRHQHPARRLPARGAEALRRARGAAHLRRDADRLRAARERCSPASTGAWSRTS